MAGLSTFDVGECCCGAGACQLCATVENCSGSAQAGATVTITKGGTLVGSCTTDGSGRCCVDITATGSGIYHVAVTLAGYAGSNQDVTVTCPGTTNVLLTVVPLAAKIRIHVDGCNAASLPGASLSIGSGSYSTDSSGNVDLSLAPGAYPYTLTKTRFLTLTGTLTVLNCGGQFLGLTMAPSPGYICCGMGGAYSGPIPMADTLHGSDSAGSFTISNASGWVTCHDGPLGNSSVNGPEICDPIPVPPCGRNPNDLGTHSCAIKYQFDPCSFGPGGVGMASDGVQNYYDGCNGPGTCTNGNVRQAIWINAVDCAHIGATTLLNFAITGYTLDSPPPGTSITVTFQPGNGVWDQPFSALSPPQGAPPSTTVTLIE